MIFKRNLMNRRFEEHNYHAIYCDHKTTRYKIRDNEEMTPLEYPEFYDIKITNKCSGNCPYCYQDCKEDGEVYKDIVKKFISYFGNMNENQRPFQIAINDIQHPEIFEFIKTAYDYYITPNYTTNGMWTADKDYKYKNKIIEYTKKYCGGVAVSCHPHLSTHWTIAAKLYIYNKIPLNFHCIISDKESIDYFLDIKSKWEDKIDGYFVLLPYITKGRAKKKEVDYDYLKSKIARDDMKISFGANFYEFLKKEDFQVSLYMPEMFSKYIDFKGNGYIYNSSFEDKPIKENIFK